MTRSLDQSLIFEHQGQLYFHVFSSPREFPAFLQRNSCSSGCWRLSGWMNEWQDLGLVCILVTFYCFDETPGPRQLIEERVHWPNSFRGRAHGHHIGEHDSRQFVRQAQHWSSSWETITAEQRERAHGSFVGFWNLIPLPTRPYSVLPE